MPANRNPTTLTPDELMKMNKKAIAEHFGTLQVMFTERNKKYGVSFTGSFHQTG